VTFKQTAYKVLGGGYNELRAKNPQFFSVINGKCYVAEEYIKLRKRWEMASEYTYDIFDYFGENVEIVKRLSEISGIDQKLIRGRWNRLFGERKSFQLESMPFIEAVEKLYKEAKQ